MKADDSADFPLPFQLTLETRVHMRMQHQNIMRLEEFYLTRTKMFLVLELMRGGSLLDMILERGGLTEGEAKLVFREVRRSCAGLHGLMYAAWIFMG